MSQFSTRKSRLSRFKSICIRGCFIALASWVLVYPFVYPPESEFLSPKGQLAPGVPNFAQITSVEAKKIAFFDYLLPEVNRQNELVMQDRLFLMTAQKKLQQNITLADNHLLYIQELGEKYRIKDAAGNAELVNQLIKRVDIIPAELVLVQAANESAWGTSRFAQQGFNFFGLWCFKQGCG